MRQQLLLLLLLLRQRHPLPQRPLRQRRLPHPRRYRTQLVVR